MVLRRGDLGMMLSWKEIQKTGEESKHDFSLGMVPWHKRRKTGPGKLLEKFSFFLCCFFFVLFFRGLLFLSLMLLLLLVLFVYF